VQATAHLVWLQVVVVGDLEVAAYIVSHALMLVLLLAPAWCLRPAHPQRRHLVYTCVRLLHAVGIPLAAATSPTPQYHIAEMVLQQARWRVFVGTGWVHALLLQVGAHPAVRPH
jgi:hypothetical protein